MSVADFENSLKKVGRTQDANRRKGNSMFSAMGSQLTSVLGGITSITAALTIWKTAYAEIIQQVQEIAEKHDDMTRKFQIQSGLRGLEAEDAQNRVFDIAERQAFTSDKAYSAATQMISSGYAVEEGSGGSLEEFLRILNASNANNFDIDPKDLAQALSTYLTSQGMEKNEQNTRHIGRILQRLFINNNVQLADLVDFSGVGTGLLKQGFSQNEQLALFATARNAIGDSGTAAKALQSFALSLGTAGTQDKSRNALADLGLSVEDVDFVGEDVATVMDRVKAGFESVPQNQRDDIAKQLFGKQFGSRVLGLIDAVDNFRENLVKAENAPTSEAFTEDVRIATTGRNAAKRRQQVRKERQLVERDDYGDLIREQATQDFRDQGLNEFSIALKNLTYDSALKFGFSSDSAAGFAYGNVNNLSQGTEAVNRVKEELNNDAAIQQNKKLTEALDNNTKAIKDQTEQQKKPLTVTGELKTSNGSKADVTPRQPRPFEGGR